MTCAKNLGLGLMSDKRTTALWTSSSPRMTRAFLDGLRKRLGQFALSLNEAKTRMLEFGRYAIERRARRGQRRPETFDFLGFTHICGQRRKTRSFVVRRLTVATRLRATLKAIRAG